MSHSGKQEKNENTVPFDNHRKPYKIVSALSFRAGQRSIVISTALAVNSQPRSYRVIYSSDSGGKMYRGMAGGASYE